MNVTISLDDELCRLARHRAVDAKTSLSGWLAQLVKKEVIKSEPRREANLLDVLGDAEAGNVDLEIPQFKESPTPANLNA
jgi:hypothetical protein